ncbi:MAG TPA: glycosyltransferase family 39 protein [Tepidisphaeraceae bacterium]|jgi:4-amino-4-deoxy-L-arabinose transferase-like glycosyltransferase
MTSAAPPFVDTSAPPAASNPAAPLTLDAAPAHAAGPVPALPGEGRAKRVGFGVLAAALAAAFLASVLSYWQPLHSGVDQNGYLVGGRQLANTLSMRQAPRQIGRPSEFDPHYFVANMWVAAANDPRDYFPKYPVGLPLIYAICLWVGGSEAGGWGVHLAYLVSPVAMVAAVAGVFVLTRQFAGSFPAILAMLVFATSPTTCHLVNNPNSHAATVFCVVWGMIAVLHWWRFGGLAWAVAGGLLVGYATTIRYTEGILVLPLAWAALTRTWDHLRTTKTERHGPLSDHATMGTKALQAVALLIAWATPPTLLVLHNLLEFGMITGYDGTSESVGFAWKFAADNWGTILRQMSENGLFLIFPVAIAGALAMFWWNWRLATFLWLWAAPTGLVYTFYYWAPDGLGYTRFFLTILPPLVVGAFWLVAHLRDLLPASDRPPRGRWMAPTLVVVAVVAALAALYLPRIDKDVVSTLLKTGAWTAQSFAEYTAPATTAYANSGAAPALIAAVVVVTAGATAIAAALFLGRAVASTLAGGLLACLSVAVQADNSARQFERDEYDRSARLVAQNEILRLAPPGAVVICREDVLHPLQFVRDYYTYTGNTFDKTWVEGRRISDEANPIDPNRVRLLQKALAPFDQAALGEQARRLVRDALAEKRRVFVIESPRSAERERGLRRILAPQVPEFVRRHVERGKDKPFVAAQISSVTVEPPEEATPDPARPLARRGRVDRLPMRAMAWQIWEITAKPAGTS